MQFVTIAMCIFQAFGENERYNIAKQQWNNAIVNEEYYTFGFIKSLCGTCAPCHHRPLYIEVFNNTVINVKYKNNDDYELCKNEPWILNNEAYLTIEELFKLIYTEHPKFVTYHPTLGYPTTIEEIIHENDATVMYNINCVSIGTPLYWEYNACMQKITLIFNSDSF